MAAGNQASDLTVPLLPGHSCLTCKMWLLDSCSLQCCSVLKFYALVVGISTSRVTNWRIRPYLNLYIGIRWETGLSSLIRASEVGGWGLRLTNRLPHCSLAMSPDRVWMAQGKVIKNTMALSDPGSLAETSSEKKTYWYISLKANFAGWGDFQIILSFKNGMVIVLTQVLFDYSHLFKLSTLHSDRVIVQLSTR